MLLFSADTVMGGGYNDPEENEFIIVARKSAVIHVLTTLIESGVTHPLAAFHLAVTQSEEAKRIKQVTLPTRLDNEAARIAAVVESERPVKAHVLRCLVDEEATPTADKDVEEKLRRKNQSLKAKLSKKQRPKNARNKNKQAGRGNSRPSQGGRGAGVSNKGSAVGAKKKQQIRSNKPPAKSARGSPTNMHN